MLSRVAENLFWMGRYLERTEHLARYINVEYFSTLDSSYPKLHELALLSIADMIGLPKPDVEKGINEEEILVGAALDEQNPVSILSTLYYGRENARSVRDVISTELWESINNFYHFVNQYPVDIYKTRGLSDFAINVMQRCSNVRGRVQHTLLHDVGWMFIQLGICIESASQIIRIMISKIKDMEEIKKLKLGRSINEQQWDILLDCVEAKDMCKKYYTRLPNRDDTIDFLLFNPYFPRSSISRLNDVMKYLKRICITYQKNQKSIEFRVAKIITPIQFMEVQEIDDHLIEFLNQLLSKIYLISDLITEDFFN